MLFWEFYLISLVGGNLWIRLIQPRGGVTKFWFVNFSVSGVSIALVLQVLLELFESYPYLTHYDVIKWKHFPCYWPFVWGIYQSPVNSPHKGQWCRALMFSLICAWINGWLNNREAGDLRRHCAHYVMYKCDSDSLHHIHIWQVSPKL